MRETTEEIVVDRLGEILTELQAIRDRLDAMPHPLIEPSGKVIGWWLPKAGTVEPV